VNERWVCKRCFADNDDTNAACIRCGLLRGAEAPAEDQSTWAARTAPGEPPLWRRLVGYWWIPALGIALLVGYLTTAQRGADGSLTSTGRVSVDDLRPGDCFSTDATELTDVDGVPCTEEHAYEVFAVDTHQAASFPSDDEMESVFFSLCPDPFEDYVGRSYADSALWASMITPSEESWADGDRTFICYLYDPDDEALTASMRDAAR
jgi:hypothetical protein